MALFTLAHQPTKRQGSTFIDHVDHQGNAAAAHDTAIHDQHQGLQGQMRQQDVGIGQKIDLLTDPLVADPSGEALDATLGLGAVRHLRRDFGEVDAFAGDNPTDQSGQGGEMPGSISFGLIWLPLCEGIASGTITAKVVTHRLHSLYEGKIHRAYTMSQLLSNVHFKIDYGKCPVVKYP